ncbi:uncharacterized protein isoform X2 [Choristoneura fumiferana]|uniref:uncharacterized protein isoform X2 n=1 Tax=Choristoneura fumiferana TaxID=7141 RepID=UPI003D15E0C8
MTSEGEADKTTEFVRRRKLRLQQVREQSKDIAKLIRQRAKIEKLRQVVELDANQEKDYLQRQEKVVKKLEELYSKGLQNFGTSHKDASGLKQPGGRHHFICIEKTDLSRLRGKEAAAELKRSKQQKLDEQKKTLDRKIQAREAANIISREKSTTAASKLSTKSSTNKLSEVSKSDGKIETAHKSSSEISGDNAGDKVVTRNDMGTQWDTEILPLEWEPNIPALPIPKDDSNKESMCIDTENNTEKKKRPNLFALSDEMPSSLRGSCYPIIINEPAKPSLTLVSEYIQNRALRLRETPVSNSNKKNSADLQNLKQTILRTRSLRAEATPKNAERPLRGNSSENIFTKKKSVTMYNHITKDTRDVPFADEQIVVRDMHSNKDAYIEALSEAASNTEEKQNKKLQDVSTKIAVTRQSVEKEYKDTMAFLNGLPKSKGLSTKPIKNAYKDDYRLNQQKENRQKILQQEFKNMEKEASQQRYSGCKSKSTIPGRKQCRHSKSPTAANMNDQFIERDFQYSWMPVPESDGNLAVHTIPTNVKEGKSGNNVKFSKVDSYHEYRSRHKHTPPTKDTGSHDKKSNKRVVEAVIIQHKPDDSSSGSSIASDNSSAEDITFDSNLNKYIDDNKSNDQLTDAERIIIYKILDNKKRRNDKMPRKSKVNDVIQQNGIDKDKITKSTQNENVSKVEPPRLIAAAVANDQGPTPFDELGEGIYKIENEKQCASYNILNYYTANTETLQSLADRKPWWDNVSSMQFSKDLTKDENMPAAEKSKLTCSCHDQLSTEKQYEEGLSCKSNGSDDIQQSRKIGVSHKCKCNNISRCKSYSPIIHPSTNTSAASFKTATNIKTNNKHQEDKYIKVIDEGMKEKGNFYIGATGFLKDDAYEVVIQLRKKDTNKEEVKKYEDDIVTREKPASDKEKNTKEVLISTTECVEDGNGKVTNGSTNCYTEPSGNPKTSGSNCDLIIEDATTAESALQMDERIHCSKTVEPNNVIPPVTTQCAFTMHDRSVITPFRDSYVIPCHVPKSDAIPRPATSSYTQTTPSSPNPRPVFIHMSSSTSTAYMSPPEVVLPNFFKRGYESCNETHKNAGLRERSRKFSGQRPNSDERSRCWCTRCLHAANTYSNKIYTDMRINQTKTPPNTARSFVTEYDYFNTYKKGSTHSSPSSRQYRRCHNCKTKCHSKLCCKHLSHKNKYKEVPPRNTRSAAAYNKKSKIFLNSSKTSSQSYLNPMIKDYIKKLLSLNREGIKAIQIINQECSSVNTPASSIINVPSNTRSHKPSINLVKNQISLEQIKNIFKRQLLNHKIQGFHRHGPSTQKAGNKNKNKKKTVHKVKSLNICKKILTNSSETHFNRQPAPTSKTNIHDKNISPTTLKSRSTSLTSSENIESNEECIVEVLDKVGSSNNKLKILNKHPTTKVYEHKFKNQYQCEGTLAKKSNTGVSSSSTSPVSKVPSTIIESQTLRPINTSTQTSRTIGDEMNFMKLAEDKLHNMEKIADLTEKCTKRLSNLAKVLEEVRKNKSLAYSQISTSDSTDSDQKSDQAIIAANPEQQLPNLPVHVTGKNLEAAYESLLFGIPKPGYIESPLNTDSENEFSNNNNNEATPITPPLITTNVEYRNNNHPKYRTKPPPALLRMHLKRPEENVVPHELSTVIEVDSPLSVKLKNQSSNADNASQSNKHLTETRAEEKNDNLFADKEFQIPLAPSDSGVSNKSNIKILSTDSSEETKLQMMDLNQFNDIMLRPFISLQEYAQEYYGDNSNLKRESVPTNIGLIEDISSLHSDGSLPDVVAELLKRKLITEPFKFDTASNINSTTVSSESTLSVLALSRVRRNKTKTKVSANKENLTETSDTLSISSNPDLENAFKKLGMGWASSTLKKTKERLALSSSSNTSSSSLSQFKIKSSNKQDMPTIVTDSVSSVPNLSNKPIPERHSDTSKNAQQQTSLTNSMTVKEFLNKELAKKITFTNKTVRNDSHAEFVSLIETKIPDELKNSLHTIIGEISGDSEPSANNNRARTSTPVQIFKSPTYHSSSSSNISNGLFSNADDLSSVKLTSTSMRYHSASEKDELTIPNFSLKMRKGVSDCSKTDSC